MKNDLMLVFDQAVKWDLEKFATFSIGLERAMILGCTPLPETITWIWNRIELPMRTRGNSIWIVLVFTQEGMIDRWLKASLNDQKPVLFSID